MKKGRGNINTKPLDRAYPVRCDTITSQLVDLLARPEGASLAELHAICIGRDGRQWELASTIGALYYDLHAKLGYGIKTEDGRQYLVLPAGLDAPLPHKPRYLRSRARASASPNPKDGARATCSISDRALLVQPE
jgi:hypothetical protein